MHVLPNLIIPGAGKSGTSSLHLYLNAHPDIYMSKKKEIGYFFREELYGKGLDWYSSFFEEGVDKKYRGESSTYYFKYLPALKRIKNDLPAPKFIFVFRHPIKRILSHYFWFKSKGFEHRSFRKAMLFDLNEEYRPNYHIKKHYKLYIQNSQYYRWLSRYFEHFKEENILVITSENLKKNPLNTLNNCFDFLGVKRLSSIAEIKHNATIHRDVPKWDALIMYLLFNKNDRSFLFKTRDRIVPDFINKNYYKAHSLLTRNRILKEVPNISDADYLWVKNILSEDIRNLKGLLNRSFEEWVDLKDIKP